MRIVLIVLLAGLIAPVAVAQDAWHVARTQEGRPDLQGVWVTEFVTRTERTKEATTLEVSPEEARRIADAIVARSQANPVSDPDNALYGYDQLAKVGGVFRSSLIVDPADGKIPYSVAGRVVADRFDRLESYGFDNPEERPPYERCTSGLGAAPIRTLTIFIPTQLVQTPDHVVLWTEDVQGARIIPMGAASGATIPRFEGHGSGQWDGDTLVVETTNFRTDDTARPDSGPPIVLRQTTRIIERFTRTAHGTLLYQYTVDDPELYTMPWRAEFEFRLADPGAVYEYACHEANHSMTSMLQAGLLGRQPKHPAE